MDPYIEGIIVILISFLLLFCFINVSGSLKAETVFNGLTIFRVFT